MEKISPITKEAISGDGKPRNEERIAIFDLDGTLTTKDTFVAFLITFGVKQRRFLSLLKMFTWIGFYLARLMKDFRLKERLIGEFFSSTSMAVVNSHREWFIEKWLPKHLHPVGIKLLRAHQENGDRVILLSASPSIYVHEIARSLSIKESICTEIAENDGRWKGKIVGTNCKGSNKTTAIKAYLRNDNALQQSFAYGDSESDRHLLARVSTGFLIDRHGKKKV